MTSKKCLKCGHETDYSGEPPLSCPACGAVYSKVEQALRERATQHSSRGQDTEPRPSIAKRSPRSRRGSDAPDVHSFAMRMRDQSLYPVWRKLVGINTFIIYSIAALGALASLISARATSVTYMLIGLAASALIAIFGKASKELSLMLADLSDATIHIAASRETEDL